MGGDHKSCILCNITVTGKKSNSAQDSKQICNLS